MNRRLDHLLHHLQQHHPTTTASSPHSPLIKGSPTAALPRFSKAQILAKREEGRVWIVLHKKVYDVTEFLEEHPGGEELITDIEAEDFESQTLEFDEAEHSDEAMDDLKEFLVGKYAGEGSQGGGWARRC